MSKPSLAIKAAIFLRVVLKMQSDAKIKFDTRISIGIGSVESINEQQISDSRGDAFTLSDKGLDNIGHQRLALAGYW